MSWWSPSACSSKTRRGGASEKKQCDPALVETAAQFHPLNSSINSERTNPVLKLSLPNVGACSPYREVRKLGLIMDVPPAFIQRHPFPGPGLAVRVLGDVCAEGALETIRHVVGAGASSQSNGRPSASRKGSQVSTQLTHCR